MEQTLVIEHEGRISKLERGDADHSSQLADIRGMLDRLRDMLFKMAWGVAASTIGILVLVILHVIGLAK